MPRYNLIIKYDTYVTITQEAMRQGKSFGKLVNEIPNEYAEQVKESGNLPVKPICILCGRPAVFQWLGFGQQRLYVCALHKDLGRGMRGVRQVGEA